MAESAIKICGISSPVALAAAAEAGATHIGIVFSEDSPRFVRPRDARALVKDAPPGVTRVGVFVNAEESLLERAIPGARLQILQFHGDETVEELKKIKARHKLTIWKAIAVSTASDLEKAKRFKGVADGILFDARTPKASRLPGGTVKTLDWKLLEKYTHRQPWGLSGGLTADNVTRALEMTGAPLVDVSSGVESAPGIKDATRIKAFVEAVRAA
ncbi:MAG: phosphoribosylanthranilate isomerase [Parasphingopyxis sp.]|nr:phosphoribosylanthranilate isomerase [Sphingomonadales bacterium]